MREVEGHCGVWAGWSVILAGISEVVKVVAVPYEIESVFEKTDPRKEKHRTMLAIGCILILRRVKKRENRLCNTSDMKWKI
jgi:hypothetical protein